MLSPKELNFCKYEDADILRPSDNFSWIQEGKYYLNCWEYQLEQSWYCSCLLTRREVRAIVPHNIEMMPYVVCLDDHELVPRRMCRFRLGRAGGPERIVGNAIR